MHMKLYKTLTRCEAENSVSIHSSDRPYVYVYKNLKQHKIIHTGERQRKCEVCSKTSLISVTTVQKYLKNSLSFSSLPV